MANKAKTATFLKDPLWYKDAVIYQVHIKYYFDANNDGSGDFPGLIEKLDYIAELGVNTIWLLPFYVSPRRDDGYDIGEYRSVHPEYGTMADARRFLKEAHKRGLRVITELVINHTSDQHPWFQRARRAKKGSKWRDFYVWSDTNQKYQGTRIIFSDTENSNWTWDPIAGQYFWHRFYSHQPDLNFDNPAVLKEVLSIMSFWFDLGVDGLRLDAIPYLVEREGTLNENLPETHDVLKQIRAELNQHYPDRMLLAEANLWPEDIQQYFGNGDECHMAFHFPLMPRMYMAIAQEDRFPMTDILRQMPEIPDNCQWAIFLRNHDELTLEMVTDDERDYLWEYYASNRRARLNLGIRRRLAPLVERDRRRIELLHSLLLSMPGTPTLYYGDEIGMGDNLFLGDRHGVRTPMQWSIDRNGGFSRADPASLASPPIMDPLYGFQTVNVESQAVDPHSLLNWTRRMLVVRKQQKAFGRGTLKMLAPTNRRIFAYLREYTGPEGEHELILCVANLSRSAQAVELDLAAYSGKVPVEMIGGSSFPPIGQLSYLLTLPPYGFYWFLLADEAQMPNWYVPPVEPMPDLPPLIIKKDLSELLQEPNITVLEHESLPDYISRRHWFFHRGRQPDDGKLHLSYLIPFGEPGKKYALAEVEIRYDSGSEHYQLPLGYVAEKPEGSVIPQQLAMARLRQGRQVGLLTDAATLTGFAREVVQDMRHHQVLALEGSEVQFIPAAQLQQVKESVESTEEDINFITAEHANSSIAIDETMLLKLFRRILPGIHPEVEMGRFLTERGYSHMAPFLGEVRRVDPRGETYTLMVLQGYLSNQGDAWQWTQNTLERAVRDQLAGGDSDIENEQTALAELDAFARILGRRLGELHQALAQPSDNPDFDVVITSEADVAVWQNEARTHMETALRMLDENRHELPGTEALLAENLLARREQILTRLDQLALGSMGGIMQRVHGDLHLGQVLVVQDDAYFIDFEGNTHISLAERRRRQSPLKDVAGMLCSFDYAAAMILRNPGGVDDSPEAETVRRSMVTSYLQHARRGFLDAYRLAAADVPHEWVERDGEDNALLFHRLDTAAHQVIAECHDRPDWLAVPVQGLASLVEHLGLQE